MQRRGVGHERHARAVGPLGHRFHAPHRQTALEGLSHGTLVVRQGRAIRPIELPRAAPFALAELGLAAPQGGGGLVVEGDPAGCVGHVDRRRQYVRQGVRRQLDLPPTDLIRCLARVRRKRLPRRLDGQQFCHGNPPISDARTPGTTNGSQRYSGRSWNSNTRASDWFPSAIGIDRGVFLRPHRRSSNRGGRRASTPAVAYGLAGAAGAAEMRLRSALRRNAVA
jgi:hypothetical protein